MGDDNSLINLGDVSKPATVLIKKISDAIGAVWKPHHIRRIAKAEADAAKIKALSEIEGSEIEERGLRRLVREEGKRQENIESITAGATSQLGEDAKPEGMDLDWITNFFDKARLVSDKEMQGLWSRLLAGEATKPGSYSKRTVELVASLDRSDAELFTRLCSFCMGGPPPVPCVYDVNDEIYSSHGLSFVGLQHLEAIGLTKYDSFRGFNVSAATDQISVSYFGSRFLLKKLKSRSKQLPIGHVLLTKAGGQLLPVCGAVPVPNFIPYMVQKYPSLGFEVVGVIPAEAGNPDQGAQTPRTPGAT
jgi:hypothetical protein